MDWRTDFIITSLPAFERNFPPIELIFLQILSFAFLFLPIIDGMPKYFQVPIICCTPNELDNWNFFSSWILAQKRTSDLLRFIAWSEATSYTWRAFLRTSTSFLVTLQERKQSSAKRRWVILEAPLHIDIPCKSPSCSALWINVLSPSEHIRKRYEDKGSPWGCLLLGENGTSNSYIKIHRLHTHHNPLHPLSTKPHFQHNASTITPVYST